MVAVPIFLPFVQLGAVLFTAAGGLAFPFFEQCGCGVPSLCLALQYLAMAFRALGSAMIMAQMMLLRVNLASLSSCMRVQVA